KMNDDLKLNLKGQKKIVINGYLENILGERVFKNLRVNFPQMLNLRLYDTMAQLRGDLFISGQISNPEAVGQLFIQSLFNQPLQLSLSNATIDFNKNIASINAPLVKMADSSMGLNASVYTNLSDKAIIKSLNVKSKFINTDTILMYKDTLMKSYPITIKEGKFYSEKVFADLYGSSIYLTAFSGDFNLDNNTLLIKNIASELFNGKIAGSLDFNLKDETFNSKIMARAVSASPIFDIVSSKKDNISGIMDFDVFLKGNLSSKSSLNGDLKFIVHNGRMSTLGKLEHLLYAQNVIADNMLRTSLSMVTRAITLKDTGLFKYLKGDIEMKNGIADIKMLQSLGPLMSLYIKGQYNTENDYAKLTVLGRISDEIISGLGAFGDFSINKLMIMLTGEENKYNILPSDIEKLPQLPIKNTKEFRTVINGIIDKPSSVQTFNWISYSEKSLRQKDVPMTNVKVPSFVDELPY
ncbi:MAG: AsmA-like C-terminal region-containing protein, partial [bacterium]|nr:AsmA-like C-terminal region-containing protein [bacterium]